MKNITLSANEDTIEKARQLAEKKNSSLNELFRDWLDDITKHSNKEYTTKKLQTLWDDTSYLRMGRHIYRDELHDR